GGSVFGGAAAGVGGGGGARGLSLGFRHAEFSVASSVGAVGTAVFSVLAGLALGERPGALSLVGILLAVPAIVGVSTPARRASRDLEPAVVPAHAVAVPGQQGPAARRTGAPSQPGPGRRFRPAATGRHPAGVGWGRAAGAGFGLFFIGLDRAGSGTDLWPITISQLAAMVTVICVAVVTRDFGLPPAGTRRLSLLTGAAGAAGTAMFFLATH